MIPSNDKDILVVDTVYQRGLVIESSFSSDNGVIRRSMSMGWGYSKHLSLDVLTGSDWRIIGPNPNR